MSTLRCFVALALPDDARAALGALRRAAPPAAPVRWVSPESIHVTLKFLGDVAADRLVDVRAALGSFPWNLRPFPFTLSAVGAFPNLARPRVLWVGVTDGAERLTELADKVERALGPLGFPREERAFSPHLTIGRVKEPGPRGWADAFALNAGFEPMAVHATALHLYESALRPSGAVHTSLLAVPLAADGDDRTATDIQK